MAKDEDGLDRLAQSANRHRVGHLAGSIETLAWALSVMVRAADLPTAIADVLREGRRRYGEALASELRQRGVSLP